MKCSTRTSCIFSALTVSSWQHVPFLIGDSDQAYSLFNFSTSSRGSADPVVASDICRSSKAWLGCRYRDQAAVQSFESASNPLVHHEE